MKVSRFTPSLMKHKDLEEIFVQRHKLAQNIVEVIRDSAITPSKHHTLLIGPRGIGKTHLVSLVYHRIREMNDLDDCLLIAWLREEEWGITSFLDLLLRIFRALQEEYGTPPCPPLAKGGGEVDSFLPPLNKGGLGGLSECVEALYQLSPDDAERAGADLLKEVIGDRTLLLLMENLDEIFAGLGDEGQKRLRAFLQENACCTILATSQSLFNGVKLQTSPFYGFFRIHHLEDLTSEDATQLLANIARLESKPDLELFIRMPTGRDRIRAIHHLAGGSHRVYVIFSEFLTRESLDELVEAFMQTLDDLTPYYQARMTYLSPQQRKIIEFLCDRRHPVPVKEIAQRCFMTHQTASGQLKDLREKGYVTAEAIGRESFYELKESLMRFCLEVKKQRGEPIRLFVDFLRLWHTQTELEQRLELLSDNTLEREYVLKALRVKNEESEDPRVTALTAQYEVHFEKDNFIEALKIAERLVDIRGHAWDFFNQGYCLDELGRYHEALASYDKAIELDLQDAAAWFNRGVTLDNLGCYGEALASYDKANELDSEQVWLSEEDRLSRAVMLQKMGRYQEALESCKYALELNPESVQVRLTQTVTLQKMGRYQEALESCKYALELNPESVQAWLTQAVILQKMGRYHEALETCKYALELNPESVQAWLTQAVTLQKMGRYHEALETCGHALELNPESVQAWLSRAVTLQKIGHYHEALESCEHALELNPESVQAWLNQAVTLQKMEHYQEALQSCERALELNPASIQAWLSRAVTLEDMGRYQEALESCDKALEFDSNDAITWRNQGNLLDKLGYYEQALVSYAKAIELDPNNVTTWRNPNWVRGKLPRRTEAIAFTLFNSTQDAAVWKKRIANLIEIYDKHEVASELGQGLVGSIPALMSEMVSHKAAQTWLEVWRELTSDRREFQIPLRLLNTAVRYRETKGDKRVLLELAIEERNLLKPLLGISEGGQ